MKLRKILTEESPILRKKSMSVDVIDEEIKQLLNEMAEIMYMSEGGGLASPQIGILKRLVVIDIGQGLIKLINPEIIEIEGSSEVLEGCLSIPGKYGKVIRPNRVKVKALNENGEEILIIGEGALTKFLCHEIDHLDGILFTDIVTEYIDL